MHDFFAGRRVLLTGHTGFKGGWLALWLRELGAAVTGFGGPPPTEPALFALARVAHDLEDVRGDVRDRAALDASVVAARPEVVLHLAAQPLVRRAWREPAEAFAINTHGTVHVLDAGRSHAPGATVPTRPPASGSTRPSQPSGSAGASAGTSTGASPRPRRGTAGWSSRAPTRAR